MITYYPMSLHETYNTDKLQENLYKKRPFHFGLNSLEYIRTGIMMIHMTFELRSHAQAEIWTIVYQRIASAAIITVPITICYAAPGNVVHNTL